MRVATSAVAFARGAHLAGTSAGIPEQRDVRLLLVDDSRAHRMLEAAALTRWGIVPTIACNGSQAATIAGWQGFGIVLMGMLMPAMDGVVATARIRQAGRENPVRATVPIIACTFLDVGADPVRLARAGLTALLPKPGSAASLQNFLARWCPDKFVVN